jgi:hypothetical protein
LGNRHPFCRLREGFGVGAVRRIRLIGRSIGVWAAALSTVAVVVVPPGTASATPCDGAMCVPHVQYNIIPGGPCLPTRIYVFGLSGGGTYICLATLKTADASTWTSFPPLIGTRDYGAKCARDQVVSAQDPNGVAMICAYTSTWQRYTPDLPIADQ